MDDTITVSKSKLLSMVGKYFTWERASEIGLESPKTKIEPCKRCKVVLGSYAKGFCAKCYIKERKKMLDLDGNEIRPDGRPACMTCGTLDEMTFPNTEKTKWNCARCWGLDRDSRKKETQGKTENSETAIKWQG